MPQINVFYVPACGFSAATSAFLLTRGISFKLTNLEPTPEVRRDLERRLGVSKVTTPVLEVDGQLLMAPSLSRLKELSDEWLRDARPAQT